MEALRRNFTVRICRAAYSYGGFLSYRATRLLQVLKSIFFDGISHGNFMNPTIFGIPPLMESHIEESEPPPGFGPMNPPLIPSKKVVS